MNYFLEQLDDASRRNKSTLCVGLDIAPVYTSLYDLVDATKDYVCAYKINPAFVHIFGNLYTNTDTQLRSLVTYIKGLGIPIILDAKYGDVVHTNSLYAEYAFAFHNFDAVTVNPLVGLDSLAPFFKYEHKHVFVWASATANNSLFTYNGYDGDWLGKRIVEELYETRYKNGGIILGDDDDGTGQVMCRLARRGVFPEIPILIPGIGAQGRRMDYIPQFYAKPNPRVIVSCSRSILEAVDRGAAAREMRDKLMKEYDYA